MEKFHDNFILKALWRSAENQDFAVIDRQTLFSGCGPI